MITAENLKQKRNQILQSRTAYQMQVAACDGALKLLDDLASLLEESDNPTNGD